MDPNLTGSTSQTPDNSNQDQQPQKISPEEAKAEADALLSVNYLHTKKSSSGMYIIIAVTVILLIAIVVLSFTAGKTKNTSSSSSNSSLPSNNNPLNNGGSVDSQSKYCSNPVNANLVC